MTLRETYLEAVAVGCRSTALLIDFVVNEKGSQKYTDDEKELEKYWSERNKDKMNELLKGYIEKRRNDENWLLFKLF